MTTRDKVLPALVDALVTLKPNTAAAERSQYAIASLLNDAIKRGGRKAGEKLVESLARHGYRLERIRALTCMWRVAIPSRQRVLELWFLPSGDNPVFAHVSYRKGKAADIKALERAAELQSEFYRRYEALTPGSEGLSADDRLIQLVGEFEADVNNGGFGQYLDNKGKARAREALACLSSIGAKRTTRWLASALRARSPEAKERLDQQFYEKPEDLASLTTTHLRRSN